MRALGHAARASRLITPPFFQARPAPALEAADRALALEPADVKARLRRARALVALGRLDEARAEAERLPRGEGRDEVAAAVREADRSGRTVCARMLRGI